MDLERLPRPAVSSTPSFWLRGFHWGEAVRAQAGPAFAAILAIAAVLRFAFLGRNSLWSDEALVAWITRAHWRDIPALIRGDFHPPLYYLLMKAWAAVAGTGEAALRAPSAVLGVVSVLLVFLLARTAAPGPVALLSALLVSVAPSQIMIGQEARMQALLCALALGSTLALRASVEHGGRLRWGGYVALATLMAYTQYLGFLNLVAHGLWVGCCARSRFLTWLAGMGLAAALYAPWLPALWHHANGLPAWPNNVAFRNPLDLLGLFAFGGSVFGLGSYFLPGSGATIAQGGILLPFLLIAGYGVRSMSSDRRSLALLGLPPAVTIGVLLAISFVKPVFYPRWFVFLFPFYAVFVALGVVELAGRAGRWRGPALAALSAGLLACSVPIVTRYYFDPQFRPFQWRAAAAQVRQLVRPGDFFLYSNQAAEISFTYYFRMPHPSLTLTPLEWTRRGTTAATFTNTRAQALVARYPRVWFIVTIPFTPAMQQRLLPVLNRVFGVAGSADYNQTKVLLLVPKAPAAH